MTIRICANFTAIRSRTHCSGFTLVELLIVISIIGVLVALTMPAINSAKESGRRVQCSNNLRQLAQACLALEAKHQFLPGGGWGWGWAGDPDRGYGARQPGGWIYNILPFIDQVDLRELGKGADETTRRNQGLICSETVIPLLICPTRRKIQTYPRLHGFAFVNISDPMPRPVGRTDYAANAGSNFYDVQPPAPNTGYDPNFDWRPYAGTTNSTVEPCTGVVCRANALPTAWIKDGTSYTYMLGERYLCPDAYYVPNFCDNDQGWDMGYDYDTNRGTRAPPMQDRRGLCGCGTMFGSAHEAGFNMAFVDASAHLMPYDIDPTIHNQLGNRADGEPTQLQSLNGGK